MTCKRALDVYRRALELDPHMKRVPDLVKTLTEKWKAASDDAAFQNVVIGGGDQSSQQPLS